MLSACLKDIPNYCLYATVFIDTDGDSQGVFNLKGNKVTLQVI